MQVMFLAIDPCTIKQSYIKMKRLLTPSVVLKTAGQRPNKSTSCFKLSLAERFARAFVFFPNARTFSAPEANHQTSASIMQ